MTQPIRTRIAPSPTGDPHVGTAYMGLVNMVFARQNGGQFLLRIDDTDRTRYREGSEAAIFAALHWLGLTWDEGPDKGGPKGPYRQSERTAIYREHAATLIEAGKAYRCFCTRERLDGVRAAQRSRKETPRYDGACRDVAAADSRRRADGGEPFVVRLAVPRDGETVVRDLLRGDVRFENAGIQDQVLLKDDGFPTYHMATVVDDHLMEISHIIRAEEWISSSPIHQLLFHAFGWEPPVFCHMPLLRNKDEARTKISKRKNPTSILYYRDAGFIPAGLLNFLGLMGWGGPRAPDGTNQEVFTVEEMIAAFKLTDIRLGSPVFDLEKLKYINAQHQRRLDAGRFYDLVRDFLFREDQLRAVAALCQMRVETLGGFLAMGDFFFGDVTQRPDLLVPKGRTPEDTWFLLGDVIERLDKLPEWKAKPLEELGRALATEQETGWKPGELFMVLRVAVTGKTATPPLFESMEVLGRSRSLGRLGDALRALPEPSKKARQKREKERRASKGDEGAEPD